MVHTTPQDVIHLGHTQRVSHQNQKKMSTNASVQKEVAAAYGDVPLCVETPFRKRMLREEPVPQVVQDLAIFLSLRGDGAHYRDARCWSHVKMSKSASPDFWFFQFLLLMAETTSLSSVRPVRDQGSDPKTYALTVEMSAKHRLGKLTPPEQKKLSSMLRADHYVDLRFLQEVAQKKTELENSGCGRDNAKRGRGAPAGQAQAPPPRPAAPAPAEPVQEDWVAKALEWASNCEAFVTREEDHMVGFDVPDPAWKRVFQMAGPALLGGPALDAYKGPGDGPDFLPKVQFCVMPVPSAEDPNEVVGLICRFLIHDPGLDPMEFLSALVDNAIKRSVYQSKPPKYAQGKPQGGNMYAKELFPDYIPFYNTNHPVATSTRLDTYFQCALAARPELLETATRDQLYAKLLRESMNPVSPLHISRILTMHRALESAREAGGDSQLLGTLASWTTGGRGDTALFPAPYYAYRPDALFWHSAKNIAFKEQMFPHIGTDEDFVSALLAGRSIDSFLNVSLDGGAMTEQEREKAREADEKDLRSDMDQLRMLLENNAVVERKHVLAHSSRLVPYDTPNTFVHRAAEADRLNSCLEKQRPAHQSQTLHDVVAVARHFGEGEMWRKALVMRPNEVENWLLSNDKQQTPVQCKRARLARRGLTLAKRVEECDRFTQMLEMAQKARLKIFASLWPVEGDVDDVPVPQPIRALLRWFRDRKLAGSPAHLSREFMMFDPELGIFGNSMLRQIKMYACVGLILQPLICMLTEGLFSCYRWSPKKLAFNLLLHGRFDTGKTYTAITTLIKLTCVAGTVLPYVARSKAADTTLRHCYDLIIASDEVQQHKVSQAEAERNPEMTNKDKVKMTDRAVAVDIFTYELDPNGQPVRWTRTFHTDHYVALVEVTNYVVEAMSALASRYHRLTVAQPQLEARKLQNDSFMSAMLKSDTQGYLNTNQYLCACVYKCIQVGAMFEPYMGLFQDISNRVIDYLQSVNAISRDTGARGLEIMTPYAMQLVIHNAVHCAFDLPGAPNYRQAFTAECIRAVQPYLYCTVDITWWCWTSLASGWIEENNCNVIESALRKCGVTWGSSADNITPYEMFERDINEKIPWRRRKNEKNDKDPLIDLQYITLYGTKEQVAKAIAMHSEPRISWTDVISVFNVLAEMSVPVPWDGYRPMPLSEMQQWHKFTELPRYSSDVTYVPVDDAGKQVRALRDIVGGKKKKPASGMNFPEEYCISNSDPKIQRTVHDMPRIGANQKMAVVDLSESGKFMVHIMPWVAEYFRSERVLEALRYATICSTTREGKILTGMHLPGDQQNFRVERFTREYIDDSIQQFDLKAGWSKDGTKWLGSKLLHEDKRPPSRRAGISFDRHGGMSKTDAKFFTIPGAPTNMTDSEWKSKSEADTSLMQEVRTVVHDLDYEAARQQHLRCALPMDEPVRSPAWIETEFKKGCAAQKPPRPWTEDLDYPHEATWEMQDRREYWTTQDSVHATSLIMPELAKLQQKANQPRKARPEKRPAPDDEPQPEPEPPTKPAEQFAAPVPKPQQHRLVKPKVSMPGQEAAEEAMRALMAEVENRN